MSKRYPALFIVASLALFAGATEIHKLAKGETLSSVALRYLGSAGYADELTHYNKIPADATLRRGDFVWIPGQDREVAMRQIYSARSLVDRATQKGAEQQAPSEWKAAVAALLAADEARAICKYHKASVQARMAIAQARLAMHLSPIEIAEPDPEPVVADSAELQETTPTRLNMAAVSALIGEVPSWESPQVVEGSAVLVPESHMVQTESGWLFGHGARITILPASPPGRGAWPEMMVSVGSDFFHGISSDLLLRSEGLHHVRAHVLDEAGRPLPTSERHVRVDLTPPTLSPSASKPRWAPFDRLADVSCTITDEFGVGGMEWALGNGTFEVYTGPFTVSVKNPVRLRFRGEDLAGNIGVATLDLP
jgi:hypothetical protein